MRRGSDATERLQAVVSSGSADELKRWLDDSSPDVARAAIHRLADIEGDRAAPVLRARLLSAELSLVSDIAKALCHIGDRGTVALAISGLSEDPYTRRLAAARALGAIRDPRAVTPLRRALADRIGGVRVAALRALADIGAVEAAGDCARVLSDRDPFVRRAAVRAVARLSPHPGTDLARVVTDADRLVRLEAALHVASLPDARATVLFTDRDSRVREAAAQAAGARQSRIVAALLLDDPSSDVRRRAARTLGNIGGESVVDVLVRGLEDPDAVVRAAVLRALESSLTRQGAIDRLRGELVAERAERRRASLFALARLKAVEAAADISKLADDPDADVRLAVIHTADNLAADPEPLVRYIARDMDSTVRNSAEMWLLRRSR